MVFILGHGRSGTSLLQTILDSHPSITSSIESRFAIHFMSKYESVRNWTIEKKKAFIEDVLQEQKIYFFWEINKTVLERKIFSLPSNTSYNKICKQVYASRISFFPKTESKVIIDKNPIYSFLIPHILRVFPSAKFIHIVRDPRATSNSVATILQNINIEKPAYGWLMANREIESFKKIIPDNFHTLKYENLLIDTQKELRIIANFIGVEPTVFNLNYHEIVKKEIPNYIERSPSSQIKRLRKKGLKLVHNNLSKSINTDFVTKWKKTLSASQVQQIDSICGELAVKYDYIVENTFDENVRIPIMELINTKKLLWYYSLPIWLRELKSKPDMGFLKE